MIYVHLNKISNYTNEKGISNLASFKVFLLNEWQHNSNLGVGSGKITADYNLTNQRRNITQNVSENFDSDNFDLTYLISHLIKLPLTLY